MRKKILLAAVMMAQLSVSAQLPGYVPTADLEGWWPFTGNANDLSTHNRNGLVSGATLTSDRLGNANSAYLFNGFSDKIAVASTGITNVTEVTVSAWVKYTGDANAAKAYDTYFQFGDYPPNTFGLSYEYTNKRFNLYRSCQGSWFNPYDIADEWHHVVVVQDSLVTKIYVDGQQIANKVSGTVICYSGSNTLLFGASPNDSQWMTGSLDDIGLWTRCLTDCEIQGLFNGAAPTAITSQPVAQNGAIGGTVSFTVATNNTAATYQWQSNIGTGGTFIDLPNTGQYSGVTTGTLTVSALTVVNNNQLFRCLVNDTSDCGTLTSDIVSITINTTGINDHDAYTNSALEQNIPNPATGSTIINYHVPSFKKSAGIVIRDAGGRQVWSENIARPGKGQITLGQQQLEQGIYFYSLIIDGLKVRTRKMVFINH